MRIKLMPEELKAKQKIRMAAYYAKNKEKFYEYTKKQRAANPLARKKHDAEYRAKNSEKVAQSKEHYRLANLDKVAAAKRKWRMDNPEKMQAARNAWESNNPDKKRVHRENRRARERDAGGRMSADIVSVLMEKQKCQCVVCKKDIAKKYEIDHVVPLILGGSNDDDNLQLLCVTCNRSKGKKHPVDFMRERGFLL